jgi:hypothetical protein
MTQNRLNARRLPSKNLDSIPQISAVFHDFCPRRFPSCAASSGVIYPLHFQCYLNSLNKGEISMQAAGRLLYQRLKATLDRQGRTLTEFAAAHGSGFQNLYNAVDYAGSDRIPKTDRMKRLVQAVKDALEPDATGGTRECTCHER